MTLFYMDASRLEKMSSARVMFFDFSSVFNNIKLMRDKLDQTGLDHCLTIWLAQVNKHLFSEDKSPDYPSQHFNKESSEKKIKEAKEGLLGQPCSGTWRNLANQQKPPNDGSPSDCPAEVFDRRVITALTSTVICRKERETECERNLLPSPFILQLLFR